ncbi:MAG: fumarylacetoacetate hydrolase family protein [Xanthomonadales bacterium]|nr:fumarylacetoacetate hydrolase family protein [Xanthomonadales bacterium]
MSAAPPAGAPRPVFPPPGPVLLPLLGEPLALPVRRVFCVGRNFAEHAREMGMTVERARPVFFMKPPEALVPGGGEIPYPPATAELHHEVELVAALAGGGRELAPEEALDRVLGYAVGLDLTRRDLQAELKAKGLPWELAKGFEHSAPISALRRWRGPPPAGRIRLEVDGELRQEASLAEMIFGVGEVLMWLSRFFTLAPGDLVFLGTPAGVGPLRPGQRFRAEVEGVATLEGRIAG